MQQSEAIVQSPSNNKSGRSKSWFRSPTITVSRLILASYLRSGWMWAEFVLVVSSFAIIYFPYLEKAADFNGTSNFVLGGIAVLGPAIMVRQATGARVYLLLARLTSRSAYSRGLMLAAAFLRLPLYLFFLALVLIFHRLEDPTADVLFWGGLGILCNTILVAVLTVSLCSPIATRLQRIYFLAWLALMLFSFRPIFSVPTWLINILSLSQLPLWPVIECYASSASGSFDLLSMAAILLLGVYCALLTLVAGRKLERRELLLQ